eukprot:NODE_61_length_26588_cov_1.146778.p2 type:complete len:657 gc:universal NODE_61_length_26588_cov_1.146778:2764-794(-)
MLMYLLWNVIFANCQTLTDCIEQQDVERVREILQTPTNPTAEDVVFATMGESREILKLVFDKHPEVNGLVRVRDNLETSALHMAAEKSNLPAVYLLLTLHANVKLKDSDEKLPFSRATLKFLEYQLSPELTDFIRLGQFNNEYYDYLVKNNKLEDLKWLLQFGFNYREIWKKAIEHPNRKWIAAFDNYPIIHDCIVNYPDYLPTFIEIQQQRRYNFHQLDENGNNLIHAAIRNPYALQIVYDIVEENQINAQNHQGDTPLHLLTFENNLEIISFSFQFIIQFRPDLNVANNEKDTILHLAMQNRNLEFMGHLLVQPNLNLNPINSNLQTPMHKAIAGIEDPNHTFKVLKLYFEYNKKPMINAQDNNEMTILHHSLIMGIDKVSLLIMNYDIDKKITSRIVGSYLQLIMTEFPSIKVLAKFLTRFGEVAFDNTAIQNGVHFKTYHKIHLLLSKTNIARESDGNKWLQIKSKQHRLQPAISNMFMIQELSDFDKNSIINQWIRSRISGGTLVPFIADDCGYTVMHFCASAENLECITYFLDLKPDIEYFQIQNTHGYTALMNAINNEEIFTIMLRYIFGCLETTQASNLNPMIRKCCFDHPIVKGEMNMAMSTLNAKNNGEKTVFDLAKQEGKHNIVSILNFFKFGIRNGHSHPICIQ